ncbi:Polyhydroxyalkanoic acid synthase [Enhygromyxa salina]|uniref:Polyhydroxyalkanoic acid synthase n=1 Tax=Enhygromyxa salina TaxID=215803 RepID=A0A0C2CXI0_9BACT|nr:alpha/beta fold hydrolase [Enhygromyxa salina]KIG14340.1 Polyhydroxyalkanoic acid synthase [Enhygromyxa salina]
MAADCSAACLAGLRRAQLSRSPQVLIADVDWPSIVGVAAVGLAVVLIMAIMAWAHYGFWVRRLGVDLDYAERHELRADDGVPFTLLRLPARVSTRSEFSDPPILMVHGIASNHRNIDAEEGRSLARYLRDLGRDVWLLTLRSGQPSLTIGQRARVDFASMVEHDLPRAIEFVRKQTDSPSIDYVGFSMGGILLYAALGRTVEAQSLRRVATIGSPARVSPPIRVLRALGFLPRFVFRVVWLRALARMSAFAIEGVHTPLHRQIYNPLNVDRGATSRALVNLIEDVPAPLSADFAKWALGDGIVRVAGEDVLARLSEVHVPAIFFAGAADKVAHPEAVRAAYDAWGADTDEVEKRFVVLGVDNGCEQDYGHGDLAIGERLTAELFVPLAEFLNAERSPAYPS